MRQPTPLWRKAFLSELQEEKSTAQWSSQEKPSQPSSGGNDSSDKVGSSFTHADNGYQSRGQSASIASTTTCKSSIAGEREAENFHTSNKTNTRLKSAEILSVKTSYTSQAKLKGRLGHLVAAIAQAHHSSQSSSSPSAQHNMKGSTNGEPSRPEVLHHPSKAWVTTTNKNSESVDFISEMYMCSKCDRMYTDRCELEQHHSLCQS